VKGLKYISIILIILLLITACSPGIDKEDDEEGALEVYVPMDGGTITVSTTR
jgi:ABC-type Fe3+-citrate transport system substrate-binding protein